MKKSALFVFSMLLSLASCSKDASFESFLEEWDMLKPYTISVCPSVTDAFTYPEPWTVEESEKFAMLPIETFRSMSTCGLLETLLEHPSYRLHGPWCPVCSNLSAPGVYNFNYGLSSNKIAVEMFGRDDCFPVLSSKYLSIIKNKKNNSQTDYLEMLLASDLCMESFSEKEKVLLMAMALERKFDKNLPKGQNPTEEELWYFLSVTPHIMIAIMKEFNYAPFMSKYGTNLVDGLRGYCNLNDHDIIEYAKQFLNEQKQK